jgi:hypothetical protein
MPKSQRPAQDMPIVPRRRGSAQRIPPVDRAVIEEALSRFDREYRDQPEWIDWETNRTHRYANPTPLSYALTFVNPPQAAALEGVRLGGFLAGFSQNIAVIEHLCYNARNVGLRAAQLLLREPHLNRRICCWLPRPNPAWRKTCQVFLVWCNTFLREPGRTDPLVVKLANRRVGPRSRRPLGRAECHKPDDLLGDGNGRLGGPDVPGGCTGGLVAGRWAAGADAQHGASRNSALSPRGPVSACVG